MDTIPLPPALEYPATTIPVLMALRRLALDTIETWRSGPHPDRFCTNRKAAFAADPYLNHLFGIEWRNDYNLHLLLPYNGGAKVFNYTLDNLMHDSLSEPLGLQTATIGYALAVNLFMLSMDNHDDSPGLHLHRLIQAEKALGMTREEIGLNQNTHFIKPTWHLEMIERTARQKMLLQKGWSLNLDILERRALSSRSPMIEIIEDDAAINEALKLIDIRPHDSGGPITRPARHVLTGSHADLHIELYCCATVCNVSIGGVGDVFSTYENEIIVHRAAPESVISGLTGQLVEDVIDHPLFIGSGLTVLTAELGVIGDKIILTHDSPNTRREVRIDNDLAREIWNQEFLND